MHVIIKCMDDMLFIFVFSFTCLDSVTINLDLSFTVGKQHNLDLRYLDNHLLPSIYFFITLHDKL